MVDSKSKSSVVVTRELLQDDNAVAESEEEVQSRHTSKSRTLSEIRNTLLHYIQNCVNQFYRAEPCLAIGSRMPFRNFVGPDHKTAPHNETVVWNLICLVMFFASLSLAARFPTKGVRIALVSISGLVFIVLLTSVSIDFAHHSRSKRWQTCLKTKAHYITRRSQIQKEPWQHDTDCAS